MLLQAKEQEQNEQQKILQDIVENTSNNLSTVTALILWTWQME